MKPRRSSSLHRTQVALARRYLREHLAEDVTLAALAQAAAASPSHFVRLYRAHTGEPPFRTLTRFRLEAAARALVHLPLRSITAVALETGWATPSSFDKAFRAAFECSPSAYRAAPAGARPSVPAPPKPQSIRGFRLARQPRYEEVPPFSVAYVREQGEYSDVSAPLAWKRLGECLRGGFEAFGMHVGASHDDPVLEAPEVLRYDAGVVLGPGQRPPPGTLRATWGVGRHAVFDFHGPYRAIAAAFDAIFRRWPAQGWPQLRSGPYLELYRTVPGQVPEPEQHTELWIPVED